MNARMQQTLAMFLIIVWLLLTFSLKGQIQLFVFILGLVFFGMFGWMFAQLYNWMLKSNKVLWHGGDGTIRDHESAVVELEKIEGSKRSSKFLIFELGHHYQSFMGTKPKAIMIANEDCVRVDRGEKIHYNIRGIPERYRKVVDPKANEKMLKNLPPKFKASLRSLDIPDDVPVYVAWDPTLPNLDDPNVKEMIKYKTMYENQNAVNEDLSKTVDRLASTVSTLSDICERNMRATSKEALGKPESGLERLGNLIKPGEERQR